MEPRQQAPTDARCAIQTAAAAEQQQQSAVQQHRIVAWGWHRPRAIRRRRGDGAARATRPPRAPRRTRNLTPAPLQVRGRVDPRSASPEAVTRRCVPTAAARAVRAPRLLVTAPPLARAARSSPVLPCTSCAWGSSVATHARRAGAGSRARAAGRGQRVSSCGKLSNPCGRRCSRGGERVNRHGPIHLAVLRGPLRSVFLRSAWWTHFAPQKSAACLTLRALAPPGAACLPDLTPEPSARRTSACLPSPCRKPPRRRRAAARARLEPDDTNDSDEGEEGLAQAEHELQPGARLKRRRRPQSPKIARLRRRRPSRARDPQPCPVGRRLLPASPAWWSRLPA